MTGQRGVQIWIPVAPGYTFDDTRSWVERLSRLIGQTVEVGVREATAFTLFGTVVTDERVGVAPEAVQPAVNMAPAPMRNSRIILPLL